MPHAGNGPPPLAAQVRQVAGAGERGGVERRHAKHAHGVLVYHRLAAEDLQQRALACDGRERRTRVSARSRALQRSSGPRTRNVAAVRLCARRAGVDGRAATQKARGGNAPPPLAPHSRQRAPRGRRRLMSDSMGAWPGNAKDRLRMSSESSPAPPSSATASDTPWFSCAIARRAHSKYGTQSLPAVRYAKQSTAAAGSEQRTGRARDVCLLARGA